MMVFVYYINSESKDHQSYHQDHHGPFILFVFMQRKGGYKAPISLVLVAADRGSRSKRIARRR